MNKNKTFYVTTPIYYANSRPHLGHAYTTILADILNNFYKMNHFDTFFSTGTDEYGDKIFKAAESGNEDVKTFTNKISLEFSNLWKELEIAPTKFIRTTDEKHKQVVQYVLDKVYKKGDIYFDEYEGLYCVGCERFLGPDELSEGLCLDHQKAPEVIKEKNYFFRMSKYSSMIKKHIEDNPNFIRPESFKKEVLSLLVQSQHDLCISRPKSRLTWGIELPFDSNFVTYVWFDALINYITVLDYPDGELFEKFWKSAHHIIGKDILRPHCIYWTAMLLSCDIKLPLSFAVHGHWLMDQNKMSKSLGNQVDPLAYSKKYGVDEFRYFLAKSMVFGKDSPFSHNDFVLCINADLANNFGNLYTRVTALIDKNFNGIIPNKSKDFEEIDLQIKNDQKNMFLSALKVMEEFQTSRYCEIIMQISNGINKFIDERKPWLLAKDSSKIEELGSVLRISLEGIKLCTELLGPIMPKVSCMILKELGINQIDFDKNSDIPKGWKLADSRTRFTRINETIED